jgi:nickel superoxide dismutase
MSFVHTFLHALDRIVPARIAHAHCDIPCGIYDPHHAQMAAHTVVRMNLLIKELAKPAANDAREKHEEYHHKLERYTLVKEQHAELAKHEVRILWGDYFKPEHVQKYPDLHDVVWKVLKAGSKARQEISLQAAEDLLKATNEVARIFWDTKGIPTTKVKAPYPTEREIVVPKLG